MARINPIDQSNTSTEILNAFKAHVDAYNGRITNMKATLGHSLLAFDVYMQWYPLYKEVEIILGERLAYLFAYSVSYASDCPLCSTFFRKIIIDAGEVPERLDLSAKERRLTEFGSLIAKNHGNIPDYNYKKVAEHFTDKEMVILIAFVGQMIATNIFNNVIETDIDGYLTEYISIPKLA